MPCSKTPNERYNKSGCNDMTAYKALKNIRCEERKKLITKLKLFANRHGYEIVSLIRLREMDGDEL